MGLSHKEFVDASRIKDVANVFEQDHRPRIRELLTALGFTDIESQARLLRQTVKQTKKILTGGAVFSGPLLAAMCKELALKPDICLGRRHFDKSGSRVGKGEKWKGPARYFMEGDKEIGQALEAIITRCKFEHILELHANQTLVFADIFQGRHPIPVDLVSRVMGEMKAAKTSLAVTTINPKLRRIVEECDSNIPDGVKTIRQVVLPSLLHEVDPALRRRIEQEHNRPGLVLTSTESEKSSAPAQQTAADKTKEEGKMPSTKYEEMYAANKVADDVCELARRLEKKGYVLAVKEEPVMPKMLKAIQSGSTVVPLCDIDSNLNTANAVGLRDIEPVINLDAFVTKVRQAGADVEENVGTTQSETAETPSVINEEGLAKWQAIDLSAPVLNKGGLESKKLLAERIARAAKVQGIPEKDVGKIVGRSDSFMANLRAGFGKIDTSMIAALCSKFAVPAAFFLSSEPVAKGELEQALQVGFDIEAYRAAVLAFEATAGDDTSSESENPETSAENQSEDTVATAPESEDQVEDSDTESESVEVLAETVNGYPVLQQEGEQTTSTEPKAKAADLEEVDEETKKVVDDTSTIDEEILVTAPEVVMVAVMPPETDVDWLIDHAKNELLLACANQPEAVKWLELLVKMTRGETVNPDDYVPGWRERQVAMTALVALKEASPETYKALVASL